MRQALHIPHPFIIENGSAIFVPNTHQLIAEEIVNTGQDTQNSAPHFSRMILGEQREKILSAIDLINKEKSFDFTQYSQCSTQAMADITGLTLKEAQQSGQRNYTEPLLWKDTEEKKTLFIQAIEQQGLQALQGGRFMHVMGKTNKGKANTILSRAYQSLYQQKITTIALGDSHNDIAMLQAADIAIVIRSPHYKPPEFSHPHKIVSECYGPEGWHECIQQLLFQKK